jgi:enolase
MIRNMRMYPIFTSRGTPSVKVKVFTDSSSFSASVPSGTSRGKNEAVELPVSKVLKFFSGIRPHFMAHDEKDWQAADRMLEQLDGTGNFSKLGENMALGISLAMARAATGGQLWRLEGMRLSATFPIPIGNVIGGGAHGGDPDWQEFLLIPHRARDPYKAVEGLTAAWLGIGDELRSKGLLYGRNIENAWMVRLGNEKALEFLSGFAEQWGMRLGLDIAASTFWDGKAYRYKSGRPMRPEKHLEHVEEVARAYGIAYLEDPLHEEDFEGHAVLTESLKGKCIVAGDDLFCTSISRLEDGLKAKAASGIIIKPNQTGTLSRTRQVALKAREAGLVIIPSHRSGETDDDWLADLAIAWQAPLIKAGVSGLDVPKLNRLVELWEEIPKTAMARLA